MDVEEIWEEFKIYFLNIVKVVSSECHLPISVA